jgi:hypothetical protein
MLISMWWMLAAALVGGLVAYRLGKRAGKAATLPWPVDWQLAMRPVFNASERQLYALLREAFPRYSVFTKLPLVRFCQSLMPEQSKYWFEFLGAIHCSFVICADNGRVLAAVDLITQSPGRKSRIREEALRACRIRHLQCRPDQLPGLDQLRQWLPESSASRPAPMPSPQHRVQEARDALAQTVKQRRAQRSAWQDSSFAQDSFFAHDSRFDDYLSSPAPLDESSK